jgi:hypothetical protein
MLLISCNQKTDEYWTDTKQITAPAFSQGGVLRSGKESSWDWSDRRERLAIELWIEPFTELWIKEITYLCELVCISGLIPEIQDQGCVRTLTIPDSASILKCKACQLIGHDWGPQGVTQAFAASKQWRFPDAVPAQNVCFDLASLSPCRPRTENPFSFIPEPATTFQLSSLETNGI